MGRLVRVSDGVEATGSCMGYRWREVKLMGAWWLVELIGSGCRARVSRWDSVCGGGLCHQESQ